MPETCYRTAYRSVPVTTYRPVSSCGLCDLFCCSPPTTTYRPVTSWTYQAYMVPYTTYRLVYSDACATYDPCATTTLSAAPASCCTPATIAPAPTTPSGADVAPQTFDNGSQPADEAPLRAVPETDSQTNPTSVPNLIDPGNDRVTQRPVRQAARFHLVASPPKPQPAPTVPVKDGGWRASSD
ncbi:MAG: hypothetical protein A2V70_19685 [Planctomycetes bacterium RBG_13_63_9]|nr:MAG: hypothetical protein A2V70_19685 [Planctomycetes bacterium RBG_13_63_9]